MKYLYLVYCNEDELPGDAAACDKDYVRTLTEQGCLLDSEALASIQTATTIRVRDRKLSVSDGPYAETREQLTGYYLITARDLNDAIRIAGNMPAARLGSIEIRPIKEMTMNEGVRT